MLLLCDHVLVGERVSAPMCRRMYIFCLVLCGNGNFVQVANAVTSVQTGTSALQNAKKLQRNSRKWMCIAIIILLLIVAVIVVGVLKPWQGGKA